jgi:hypothetical protein
VARLIFGLRGVWSEWPYVCMRGRAYLLELAGEALCFYILAMFFFRRRRCSSGIGYTIASQFWSSKPANAEEALSSPYSSHSSPRLVASAYWAKCLRRAWAVS